MAKKRRPENEAERSGRLAQQSAAEERALDAAVSRSIKLHGA
ncbi:MAG TPA: hypothetical protein VF452_23765 [Candidatus Binatia bacterium]